MDELKRIILTLRTDYAGQELSENSVEKSAVDQFGKWFGEAIKAEVMEPNAFTLGTSVNGRPALRVVLMRDFSEEGFTFFTNYSSKKGQDIAENPNVCMNFFWPELARQVRVSGVATKVDEKVSDDYFATRPRESCLGAWASDQSEPVENRAALEKKFEVMKAKFAGGPVPRPPHWGGYRVTPIEIEFWQGRPSRVHDRVLFSREKESWIIRRLAP